MQRTEIKHGKFTLLVSLCGNYWVAPGGVHIKAKVRANAAAKTYSGVMAS